ncbi:MAG: cyanophycinase [Bacteroidales bacterium]|nr:cyanophycinase [Bacteroidales bacterium]
MKRLLLSVLFAFCAAVVLAQNPTVVDLSQTRHGPEKGTLVIIGGGTVTDDIWDCFIELAGGKNARIVVITNASGDEDLHSGTIRTLVSKLGQDRVTQMHLKTIDEANDDRNLTALRQATGVYFTGGRQWRIAEVYLNTKVHRELFALLNRGGVIAGSSAGASIQGSLLWRGDTRGAQHLIGDHTQGLGFLKLSAIDQHILVRNRQHDLDAFIKAAPEFIGIGIDESTAIVVKQDVFEVIGKSYVAVHQAGRDKFFFLRKGQKYDLKNHKVMQ